VQQRGIREQLPVVRDAAEPLTDRIEELECQLLNVIGVRRLVMSALRQLTNRPLTSLTRICRRRRDVRALEQNSLTDSVR
jgi:hypothetical protein